MPTYSYRCRACSDAFDIHQEFSDDSLTICPACGGELRKVFSPIGVSFTGSGFYRNDSRAKPDAGASAKKSDSSDAGAGPSSDSSSAKSEKAAPATKEKATAKSSSSASGSGSGSGSSSSSSKPAKASNK